MNPNFYFPRYKEKQLVYLTTPGNEKFSPGDSYYFQRGVRIHPATGTYGLCCQ